MIELTIEELALWAISVSFLFIGLLVVARSSRENQLSRRRRRAILHCTACNHLFEDTGSEKLVECPQCGRLTQRGRDKSLG